MHRVEISSKHVGVIRAALGSYYRKCQKQISDAKEHDYSYLAEYWLGCANETKEVYRAIAGHDIEEDML